MLDGAVGVRGVRAAPVEDRLLVWVSFCVLGALQLDLIFAHSPWFDEAQALLIAREPISELLRALKYEGHGALWFLYLGAVDRIAGGSVWSLPVAQAPISLALLALIWFSTPFSFVVRLLISLSYYVAFEYGVLSREYGLAVALIWGAVAVRRPWASGVLLALAANTDVQAAFTAGTVAVILSAADRDLRRLAVVGAGLAVSLWTVMPLPPDFYPAPGAPDEPLLARAVKAFAQFSVLLSPVQTWPWRWGRLAPPAFTIFLGVYAVPFITIVARRPIHRLALLASCLAFLVLGMLVYENYPRHLGLIFALAVVCFWLEAEDGGRLTPAASVWLTILALSMVPVLITSQRTPFTHARIIADWIEHHGLAGEIWGAWPGRQGVVLSAELGRPVVNLEKGCAQTFLRWDYPHEHVSDPEGHVARGGVRYVIADVPLKEQLLARFGMGSGWERPTWLYVLPNAKVQAPVACP